MSDASDPDILAARRVNPSTVDDGILQRPVFIVGVPRSGTSMLWSLLVKHEAFRGDKEIPRWNAETSLFDGFAGLLEEHFQPAASWGGAGRVIGNATWYEYFAGDRSEFDAWVDESLRGFLLHAARARGARRVLEKTPDHLRHLDRIARALPDARVLVLVRHPLDVLASYRKRVFVTPPALSGWLTVDAGDFGETYEKSLLDACSLQERLSMLHVRYEDLTRSPQAELERICAFLDIRFDPSLLDGAKPERRWRTFPYRSHIPIPNSEVWKNALSDEEADAVLRATARVRAMYGYSPAGEEP